MRSATITAFVGLLVVCLSATLVPAGSASDRAPRPEDLPAVRVVPERDVPPGERLRQLQELRREELQRLFQRLADTTDGPTREHLHGWIQLHKLQTELLLLDGLPPAIGPEAGTLAERREVLRARAALLRARHGEPEIPAPPTVTTRNEDANEEGSR